jgi:hypothetical protein
MYIYSLVDRCQFPLEVVYTPAKSLHLHPFFRKSPVKTLTSAPPATLSIQPLTPKFYTNILGYQDALSCFKEEAETIPQVSDPVSQRALVSDMALLQKLIDLDSGSADTKNVQPAVEAACPPRWHPKASSNQSFIDAFTDSRCSREMYATYRIARIHSYLTEKLAGESPRLMTLYGLLLRVFVMRLIWKALWQMLCHSSMGLFSDVIMVSGVCFLLARSRRGLLSRYYP